jgi:hypothetical protein
MKYFLLLFIVPLASCFSKQQLKKKQAAKVDADYIIENLNKEDVKNHFPTATFPVEQTNTILAQLSINCDWAHRQGKYVDQATINSNGQDYVAFIYEYILKCDSIRVILMYNLERAKPELTDFKLEKLTKDNPLIIHKENELLYSK